MLKYGNYWSALNKWSHLDSRNMKWYGHPIHWNDNGFISLVYVPHNTSNKTEEIVSPTDEKFGILNISFFGHIGDILVSSDYHSSPKYNTHTHTH